MIYCPSFFFTKVLYCWGGIGVEEADGRFGHGDASMVAQAFLEQHFCDIGQWTWKEKSKISWDAPASNGRECRKMFSYCFVVRSKRKARPWKTGNIRIKHIFGVFFIFDYILFLLLFLPDRRMNVMRATLLDRMNHVILEVNIVQSKKNFCLTARRLVLCLSFLLHQRPMSAWMYKKMPHDKYVFCWFDIHDNDEVQIGKDFLDSYSFFKYLLFHDLKFCVQIVGQRSNSSIDQVRNQINVVQ